MKASKAKEFRIGNFVEYHDDGLVFEILEVDQFGLMVKNKEPETAQETWIEYDCFSPIKITEEWLINFGYEKDEDQFLSGYLDFTKGNEYIRINDNSTFYRDGNVCIGNKKNLIYVHQLQNLYFALTGEELKLQS